MFPKDMERDSWAAVTDQLIQMDSGINTGFCFILGDAYRHGRTHYNHVDDLFMSFHTDRSVKTIQNYATVASKFPVDKRDLKIPFTVYNELAHLEEKDRYTLLNRVTSGKVPTGQVRDMVKKFRDERLKKIEAANADNDAKLGTNAGKGGEFGADADRDEAAALADAQAQYDAQAADKRAADIPAESGVIETVTIARSEYETMIVLKPTTLEKLKAIRQSLIDDGEYKGPTTNTAALEYALDAFIEDYEISTGPNDDPLIDPDEGLVPPDDEDAS